MKHISTATFCLIGLLATSVLGSAEDTTDSPPAKARPSRTELRDRQYDVSLDARDIERILTRLKRASELSKQRMTEAAEAAEGVAGVIERGDAQAARKRAEETSKLFQEIAKQLEALLTEETPQRVAAARNLAAQLARAEQQFAQQTQAMSNQMQTAANSGGKGDPNAKRPPGEKPKAGQGGNRPAEDPMDQPQENSNGGGAKQPMPTDQPGKDGKKNDADDMPQDGQNGGAQKREPMPNANGGGGEPDKKPEGENKDGSGKKADEDKAKPEGTGGSGEKADQDDPKKATGGGGTPQDKEKPKGDEERRGGGGFQRPLTPEEQRDQLAERAADLANRAETLLDILQTIANSDSPSDKDAAEKVNALLKETDLKNAIAALQASAGQVRNQQLDDARTTALDIAERLQITTQRLDAVYRAIIGPQAEELRKLEQQLLQLREKLDDLQTPAQIVAWHRAVRELLDKADELGISEARRSELLEEMKKEGFSLESGRISTDWQIADGRYQAPTAYTSRLVALQEEIQSRIQNLVLGEFASMTDDLTPPKYQSLVERYYQVLSREGNSRAGTSTPAPAKTPTKP